MNSNNKKWSSNSPKKRLSKAHFISQPVVNTQIDAIITKIPEDNEYLVDIFLEQFMSYGSEESDKWWELMIDFIQEAFHHWDFERVDMLLEKIEIENLSLLQMECLLRNCFRFGKLLKNYTQAVQRVFAETNENYREYMYIFHGLFSFENGELKIHTLHLD